MSAKRTPRARHVKKIAGVRKAGPLHVTRAEFDVVIRLLNERGEIINALRRDLETQFTRIAQIQQELDDVKNKLARS